MKASALFLMVKADLETLSRYRSIIEEKLQNDTDPDSIGSVMTRYNYANFTEILSSKGVSTCPEVDDKKLEDFQRRIDNYLGLYAPGDEDLKKYITGISTYLAFIVRRPLHPPGIQFSNGIMVYEQGGMFYCTGRRTYIKDELSLCKYCICRSA